MLLVGESYIRIYFSLVVAFICAYVCVCERARVRAYCGYILS